ncbi:hypothetical protein BHM03_00059566, partial [Ensete ventricosum]
MVAFARWQSPLLAAWLAASGSPLRGPYSWPPLRAPRCNRLPPLRAGRSRSCPQAPLLRAVVAPCEPRWPPFQAGPSRSQPPPCRGPWPWPGCGWSTLHGGWSWLAAPPLRCENATRIRRTILRDTISSH